MEFCVPWRHKDEIRRKVGLSAERNDFTEFTLSNGGTMPRKILRRKILMVLIFLMVMAVTITCIYIHQNKEEIVPIEELTDDTNWGNSKADEFSLDW